MPPKRERSHSPSSNHDIEKRLCVADPPSAQVLNAGASQTAALVSNNHLGSVSVCDSSDDERQPGAVATAHDPWDLEFVEIDDDDDNNNNNNNGDTRDSEGGDCAVEQASGSATDGASGEPLLGLHKQLKPHTSKINTLLGGAVGDCYVKLTDIPDGADWNFQNYLSAVDGRALVLVAFGSLCFVHLQFGRMMLPSFSVSVELLRDSEKDALQNILDLAENRHEEATRHLRTFRAAHDEHSRFMNVFDCTRCTRGDQEGRRCGINEFTTGDFVRVVMRCMKVVDDETGRVRVEFKLRRLDLLVSLSRKRDITN